jgi:hypothetical protein
MPTESPYVSFGGSKKQGILDKAKDDPIVKQISSQYH